MVLGEGAASYERGTLDVNHTAGHTVIYLQHTRDSSVAAVMLHRNSHRPGDIQFRLIARMQIGRRVRDPFYFSEEFVESMCQFDLPHHNPLIQ